MADKRMFSKKVIGSDAFRSLNHSGQLLYFYLCLYADDEGFVDCVGAITDSQKMSQKDIDGLIENGFVLHVSKYVYVVRHWFVHNTIAKDRFHPTIHSLEKSLLVRPDNVWCFAEGVDPFEDCQPEPAKPVKKKEPKKAYGSMQNVMLTDKEYQGLIDDFGADLIEKKIEAVSLYIAEPKNAKKYSDHNITIRRWIARDAEKPAQKSFADIADDYTAPTWDIDL